MKRIITSIGKSYLKVFLVALLSFTAFVLKAVNEPNNTYQTSSILQLTVLNSGAIDNSADKTDAQLHALERKTLTDMGAEIEGYETFLGKNCLKFKWGTTKFLQFKGIPLKSNVSEMGISYIETATGFETNIVIPATKFEIPKNVKFEDMGEMMDILQNETN